MTPVVTSIALEMWPLTLTGDAANRAAQRVPEEHDDKDWTPLCHTNEGNRTVSQGRKILKCRSYFYVWSTWIWPACSLRFLRQWHCKCCCHPTPPLSLLHERCSCSSKIVGLCHDSVAKVMAMETLNFSFFYSPQTHLNLTCDIPVRSDCAWLPPLPLFDCFFTNSSFSTGEGSLCRMAKKLDGKSPSFWPRHFLHVAEVMYALVGCPQKFSGLNDAPDGSALTTSPKCSTRTAVSMFVWHDRISLWQSCGRVAFFGRSLPIHSEEKNSYILENASMLCSCGLDSASSSTAKVSASKFSVGMLFFSDWNPYISSSVTSLPGSCSEKTTQHSSTSKRLYFRKVWSKTWTVCWDLQPFTWQPAVLWLLTTFCGFRPWGSPAVRRVLGATITSVSCCKIAHRPDGSNWPASNQGLTFF